MRLKSILLLGVGLVAVTLVGGLVVLGQMDFGKYKSMITEQAEQATGRKLTIGGQLTLSVFPTPALTVHDVSFANADWGSTPNMATFGELRARISILPFIFGGTVHIAQFDLSDAQVLLETDDKGRGNWVFAAKPVLSQAVQKSGQKSGPKSGPEPSPKSAPAASTPAASTPSAPPASADGSAMPALTFDSVKMHNILVTYRDGATHKSTSVMVSSLTASGSLAGPLRIAAELNAEGAELTVDGTVQNPIAQRGIAITLTLEGKTEVASGGKSYHLSTTLVGDIDKGIVLKPLQGNFGASAFTGDASIDLSGVRPRIGATLHVPQLDLTDLSASPTSAETPNGQTSKEQASPSQSPASNGSSPSTKAPSPKGGDDGHVFSNDPLPLDSLHSVDADVAVDIGLLKTEQLLFHGMSGRLSLDNGELKIKPLTADLNGSPITIGVALSVRNRPATLDFDLNGQKLDMGKIVEQFSGKDLLDAKGDLIIAVHGAGDSVRALMATLDGKSSLVVSKGLIKNRYADLIGADVFREVVAWTGGKHDTPLNCLVTRFDIQRGLATSRGMLMDTGDMSMVGEGTINLGTERIELELTPRPKNVSVLNLATPIDIGGSLKHPSVQLNRVALAKRVAGGVATSINPLFAIGSLVLDNSGDSDQNPCVAALEGKTSAKAKEGGVSGAVKGLGDMFDSLTK